MITITLNGNNTRFDSNISIKQLLEHLDLIEKRLAVEVNQEIISHSNFESFILNDLDRVEIVQAIGGGSR
ncbi:MAG: sulfur carrier protein ThiS [Gammaproteobacteria bacterium]|nr:sulfur carrier protein ThiS [Gammaproteobacteria bacterium]